jgi:hypothetical protein
VLSYIDLDPFLDLVAFQALKPELDLAVERTRQAKGYNLGRQTTLRRAKTYEQKMVAETCQWGKEMKNLPGLLGFIQTLPFEGIGRVLLLPDRTLRHQDPIANEFIWMQVGNKRFFVEVGGEQHYVTSTFAWFDASHFHGSEEPESGSYSLRVDGVFKESFRQTIRENS